MPENHISDDFIQALLSYENPQTLFEMAKTDWEKAVAIEFHLTNQKIDKNSNDLKWLKWLIQGTLAVGVLSFIVECLTKFI